MVYVLATKISCLHVLLAALPSPDDDVLVVEGAVIVRRLKIRVDVSIEAVPEDDNSVYESLALGEIIDQMRQRLHFI